jgi:succinate dehydrogenase / fumarate reductase flavoprotein subunit
MAALEAARRGKSVVIVSKVQPFVTHSVNPEAGVNVCLGGADNWRQQAEDVWNDGHFLSDWDAVEVVCKEGPEIILREFGDLLNRDEQGEVVAYDFAGTARAVKAGGHTGLNFLRRLYAKVSELEIPVLTDRVVTSLVVKDKQCVGIVAFNVLSGQVEGYAAPSVALCMGGFGHVYQNTVHSSHMTGDGQAVAFRAGVPLKDMEFVRFNQTVIYGTNFAITEGAFLRGMRLFNKHNERFMEKYDPRMEAIDLFHLKRYMQFELDAGLGVEGRYFFADFRHLSEDYINKELPMTRRKCLLALGLDIVCDRVPVAPGVYITLGGVETDACARTMLPGLYAAGECACPGVHGADWKIGNTVLAALAFGSRAGVSAAQERRKVTESVVSEFVHSEITRLDQIASRAEGEPYHLLVGGLRQTMSKDVAIVRAGTRLENALGGIGSLKRRYKEATLWDQGLPFNQQLVGYLELGSMLDVAEAVTSAALAREESRGTHWRSDFPERDDKKWLCHSLQYYTPNGPRIEHPPVRMGAFTLKESVILR